MKLTQQNNELILKGEITFQNANAIIKKFKELEFTEKSITINCESINNASSVCLAVLLEMKKVLKNRNKQTLLKGLSKPLKALVKVSQLSEVLH